MLGLSKWSRLHRCNTRGAGLAIVCTRSGKPHPSPKQQRAHWLAPPSLATRVRFPWGQLYCMPDCRRGAQNVVSATTHGDGTLKPCLQWKCLPLTRTPNLRYALACINLTWSWGANPRNVCGEAASLFRMGPSATRDDGKPLVIVERMGVPPRRLEVTADPQRRSTRYEA